MSSVTTYEKLTFENSEYYVVFLNGQAIASYLSEINAKNHTNSINTADHRLDFSLIEFFDEHVQLTWYLIISNNPSNRKIIGKFNIDKRSDALIALNNAVKEKVSASENITKPKKSSTTKLK